MIVNVGIDMVEISRIKKAITQENFLKKYFTEEENALFLGKNFKPETIAANFAVKEAVSKVFGTGIRGFGLKDIEVLRDELGKPYIILYSKAREISEKLRISKLHVSVTHSRDCAAAVVVAEE